MRSGRLRPVMAIPSRAGTTAATASMTSGHGLRLSRRQSAQARARAGGSFGHGRERSRRPRQWLSSAIQNSSEKLKYCAASRARPERAESARSTPAGNEASCRHNSSQATAATQSAASAAAAKSGVDSPPNTAVTPRVMADQRSPATPPATAITATARHTARITARGRSRGWASASAATAARQHPAPATAERNSQDPGSPLPESRR